VVGRKRTVLESVIPVYDDVYYRKAIRTSNCSVLSGVRVVCCV